MVLSSLFVQKHPQISECLLWKQHGKSKKKEKKKKIWKKDNIVILPFSLFLLYLLNLEWEQKCFSPSNRNTFISTVFSSPLTQHAMFLSQQSLEMLRFCACGCLVQNLMKELFCFGSIYSITFILKLTDNIWREI